MIPVREQARLADETRHVDAIVNRQRLQCDHPPAVVSGSPHRRHATLGDAAEDAIARNVGGCGDELVRRDPGARPLRTSMN